MTVVPDSRKTYDPEYKKAKEALKTYIVNTKKIIASVKNLGERALAISKCYSKLCSKVTSWYPDSPPAVRQSLHSITKSADNLNKMTVDDFLKSFVPSFEQIMKEYKKRTNNLLSLEKNRRTAVRAYDKNREKLRTAQCAREPDEEKIDHLQRQVNATESTYNTLNDQYITEVNNFTEERKADFLRSLSKCFENLMKYINETTQISIYKFPDDPNSPLIVDAKTVAYHDDLSQHINSSLPILPPAASNSGMPNQMPTYFPSSNNYRQTLPPSQQGYYDVLNQSQVNGPPPVPLPPSPNPYNYVPGQPQNGMQGQNYYGSPSTSTTSFPYAVEPQVINRNASESSQLISNIDEKEDSEGFDKDESSISNKNNSKDDNNYNNNNTDNKDDKNGKKTKKSKKHWKSRKSKSKKSRASKPYY